MTGRQRVDECRKAGGQPGCTSDSPAPRAANPGQGGVPPLGRLEACLVDPPPCGRTGGGTLRAAVAQIIHGRIVT